MDVSGLTAVVPTAFHDDASVDVEGTAALVEAYGQAGAVALTVLGVTGEGHLLDTDERRRVVSTVRRAAAGLPLVVGVGNPGPGQPVRAQEALDLGADALLVGLAPEPGRSEALGRVADLGAPVVVQDNPGATGVRVPADETVKLARAVEAVAVQAEAPPTSDLVAALCDADGPAALGGLSALHLLEELETGAAGAMTGLALPAPLVETLARWRTGDRAGAHDTYVGILPYLRLEAMPGTVGLVVRKEAWRQRGVIASSRVRHGEPLGLATKRAVTRRLRDVRVEVADPVPDT